jgi:hypothetical protein
MKFLGTKIAACITTGNKHEQRLLVWFCICFEKNRAKTGEQFLKILEPPVQFPIGRLEPIGGSKSLTVETELAKSDTSTQIPEPGVAAKLVKAGIYF